MHCKYCHTAIPSKTGICPNCGRMASSEQMQILKDFNKNSGWDRYSNPNTSMYKKESAHEQNKIIGIILVPLVILILIVIALIRVLTG
ncbi:MAG: hypothetical protein ACI31M_04160 [Bacilli bacterium]